MVRIYETEPEAQEIVVDFIHACLAAGPGKYRLQRKRLGITVFHPRLKVRTFARTNSYEYGKQRQVQESA